MDTSILMKSLDAIASEVPRIAKLATQEERAAVVAWLRLVTTDARDLYHTIADHIERGEHRREGEK